MIVPVIIIKPITIMRIQQLQVTQLINIMFLIIILTTLKEVQINMIINIKVYLIIKQLTVQHQMLTTKLMK